MKYVKQIGIILGITLAGEVLYLVLPLPVPAAPDLHLDNPRLRV